MDIHPGSSGHDTRRGRQFPLRETPFHLASTPVERVSPREVTSTAARSVSGHFVSQIPHPTQRSSSMYGFLNILHSPPVVSVLSSLKTIALLGVGQCSSQTMQSDCPFHGRQRLRST